jgi:hypothetical protein
MDKPFMQHAFMPQQATDSTGSAIYSMGMFACHEKTSFDVLINDCCVVANAALNQNHSATVPDSPAVRAPG